MDSLEFRNVGNGTGQKMFPQTSLEPGSLELKSSKVAPNAPFLLR